VCDRRGPDRAVVGAAGRPGDEGGEVEFVGRVAADNRINTYFQATASNPKRLAAFKAKPVDQICEASGGPCKYKGKDMKSAHMDMHVTGADFDALVEDLVGALDKFKVGEHERHQLLSALGPMKGDIVESGK
jgi:hemoglobin